MKLVVVLVVVIVLECCCIIALLLLGCFWTKSSVFFITSHVFWFGTCCSCFCFECWRLFRHLKCTFVSSTSAIITMMTITIATCITIAIVMMAKLWTLVITVVAMSMTTTFCNVGHIFVSFHADDDVILCFLNMLLLIKRVIVACTMEAMVTALLLFVMVIMSFMLRLFLFCSIWVVDFLCWFCNAFKFVFLLLLCILFTNCNRIPLFDLAAIAIAIALKRLCEVWCVKFWCGACLILLNRILVLIGFVWHW